MSSAPPSTAPNAPPAAGAADGSAPLWAAAWALAAATLAALLLVFGAASGALLGATAAAAIPGALAYVWRPKDEGGRSLLLCLFAAGAAAAVGLSGGLAGPLALWLTAPLLAAVAAGGSLSMGAGAAFAALIAIAVVQAGGGVAPRPSIAVASWLALGAAAMTLGLGAAALMLGAPRGAGRAPGGVSAPASPAVEPAGADAWLSARLAAAEAARARAEAQAAGRMRLIANVSHELRTPLNAIMGFSDIMRQRLFGELTPRYAEYAELIHESGAHLLDLIGDVLDVSKIDADKYVLAREVFDVRDAVAAALRIVRQQADEAGVALRSVLPGEPLEIDADRRAIKQILLNLVANAVKFTPAGGAVSVTARAADGVLELVVADTGVGIAPEDLERLGRPYEQAGEASDRARGTGLGLSLVHAFARLHGGEALIESRLGEGSAVTVRLPVLEAVREVTPGVITQT